MIGANRVLASLPRDVLEKLASCLREIALRRESSLDDKDIALFPTSAVIAYEVAIAEGSIITGVVGKTGMFDPLRAFDVQPYGRAHVLVAGVAFALAVSDLRDVIAAHPALRRHILTSQIGHWADAQQSAVCNAVHKVDQRICRWLHRMQEEVGHVIPIKQTDIAKMLGVQRTSVSASASKLQAGGIIAVSRGTITIVNPQALRAVACECASARNTTLQ